MKKWFIMASVLLGAVALKTATVFSATAHTGKCPLCRGK
jgi:hypothetical protein